MPSGAPTPLQLSGVTPLPLPLEGSRCRRTTTPRLAPRITHIGVGGFHRSHLAAYTHELAQTGSDWGPAGSACSLDAAMAAALDPQDRLYSLIEKDPTVPTTGSSEASLTTATPPDARNETVDLLADPSVTIVSMITEAGYAADVAENSTFDLLVQIGR